MSLTELGRHPIKAFVIVAVVLAVVCAARPVLASPGPATSASEARQQAAQAKARMSASQAALDSSLRAYSAGRARLDAIDETIAATAARLDSLIGRQARLQRQLGARATSMYRNGPLGFLEVLAGSTTFDEFATLWDTLTRLNRQDAWAIRDLKATRSRISRCARDLLTQQAAASAQVRALETAKAKALRDLSGDRATYQSYRDRIAAIERQRAGSATGAAVVSGSRASKRPRPSGSGPWKSAIASHYGSGSYGTHLSSGVVVGPDSMIVAHKTLPFGTLVEFRYKGRTAVASVADRGPYYPGREFDLGPGTARVLGFVGVDEVGYRVIPR